MQNWLGNIARTAIKVLSAFFKMGVSKSKLLIFYDRSRLHGWR